MQDFEELFDHVETKEEVKFIETVLNSKTKETYELVSEFIEQPYTMEKSLSFEPDFYYTGCTSESL